MPFRARLVGCLLALAALAPAVLAQPAAAPVNEAANAHFEAGLALYAQGDYAAAYLRFLEAASAQPYHTQTTAAYLMMGKARYAQGDFDGATSALTTLLRDYPRSRYAAEARSLMADIAARTTEVPAPPFRLGVLLPTDSRSLPAAQALFNGIRLAVDLHNAQHPRRPVQLVFRETQGTADGARLAMGLLLRQNVEALIGPLFSEEAAAAAAAAETARIPLLAPLATDEGLTTSRRYTFQVNPPFSVRGQTMARYAVEQLGILKFGIVTQQGTYGQAMAQSFRAAVEGGGGQVAFFEELPNAQAWTRLGDRLTLDEVLSVDAVYAPVTGRDADDLATAVLEAFDGLGYTTQILAGPEWDEVGDAALASRYTSTFTADYFLRPDQPTAEAFATRYRALAGLDADRVAYAGYDTARFLLTQLLTTDPRPLADRLRSATTFEGLGHRIHFANGQVNQATFICGFREGQLVLIE